MYGFKFNSANRRLVAAAYPKRLLIRPFSSTAGIDDLVYVGKGYKICGKGEIEGPISNKKTIYRSKSSRKRNETLHSNGRKVLPPRLHSRNVAKLTCDSTAAGGICDVYLIGSVHNCPVVFLELCSRPLYTLTCESKIPTMREMLDLWKNKEDPFWILYIWFIAKGANQHKWLQSNNSHGGELRAAYEEAMKYGGKVILGDRPAHITMRRRLATMSPWVHLFDPVPVLIGEDFPETKGKDIDPYLAAEVISKKFPTYAKTNIMERDRYMSAKLLEVAREHNSVVAVVGKSHLPGIQKNWKQPVYVGIEVVVVSWEK